MANVLMRWDVCHAVSIIQRFRPVLTVVTDIINTAVLMAFLNS